MDNRNISRSALSDADITPPGLYFVTVCVQHHQIAFGHVVTRQMSLNEVGLIAQQTWNALAQRFSGLALHEFVVMPNHMHGILEFFHVPQESSPRCVPLGEIIRTFKASTCRQIRCVPAYSWFAWQRRYYASPIRSETHLENVRQYIKHNPVRWTKIACITRKRPIFT